jgi:hypothetical protein
LNAAKPTKYVKIKEISPERFDSGWLSESLEAQGKV